VKLLLTGNRGKVGTVLETELRASGHDVVGYDRLDGRDILDVASLQKATQGCEAVIHSAVFSGYPKDSPQALMSANLQGTWNILVAAAQAQARRVIYLSSVDALGVFKGERKPDYLPLDDDHPCYPSTPYGISKRLSEEMCRLWSASTNIPTICLRPPGVWLPETYHEIQAARRARPEYEWDPYWEYGAFIDVRDLSAACIQALTCPVEGHACVLVAAADITTSGRTSRELARFVHPDVEWRGGEEFETDPFRSLLVTDNARRLLGWEPRHTWQAFVFEEKPLSTNFTNSYE
jgi:nucleoside-diphosphate-sugar epimerase